MLTQMTVRTCLQGQKEVAEKEPSERQKENQENRSIQLRKDVLKVSNTAESPKEKKVASSGSQKASSVLVRTMAVPRCLLAPSPPPFFLFFTWSSGLQRLLSLSLSNHLSVFKTK